MRSGKRRKIGVLTNRETGADGTNESGPETRATVIEEGDVIKVTFGGDTEDELDDLDEDEEADEHNTSPLTTRVLISEQMVPGSALGSTKLHVVDNVKESETNDAEAEGGGLSGSRAERLDNIWTKCDNALRDLLVFLVKKYRVDEVYDSKIKAQNWEKLIMEFNSMAGGIVGMPKAQIIRKWHNWKQYNKQRSKAHPFIIVGNIGHDEVMEKCRCLIQQAQDDPTFAAFLAKGGNEPQAGISEETKKMDTVVTGGNHDNTTETAQEIGPGDIRLPGNERVKRLRDRDFLVRRTGVSAASLSIKKLEHEIALESLSYEQERWRVRVENNQLQQQKLHRQSELAETKLERARTELALKKHECMTLGLSV